jgi:hypothetical protein
MLRVFNVYNFNRANLDDAGSRLSIILDENDGSFHFGAVRLALSLVPAGTDHRCP